MISGKTLKHFLALLNTQSFLSRVENLKNIWIIDFWFLDLGCKKLRGDIFGKCFLALLNNQFVLIRNSPKTQHCYHRQVLFGVRKCQKMFGL